MAQEVDGLVVEMGITEKRYLQALARLESQTVRTARQNERAFARANRGIERGFNRTGASANAFANGGLRNVSLQLSQVAQQGAASGDFVRALAIQLPDLALGFGTVGIAIGAVAGALVPLAIDMLRADDATEELADTAQDLADALKAYSNSAELAQLPTDELREKYGTATEAARAFIAALETADSLQARGAVTADFRARAGALGSFGVDLGEPIEDMRKAREALIAEVERLATASAASLDVAAAVALDRQREAVEAQLVALDRYIEDVGQLSKTYGIATDQAERLASAVNAVYAADGTREEIQAAQELQSVLTGIFGTYNQMPAAIQEVFREVARVGEQAAVFQAEVENAESSMLELVQAIAQAVGGMEGLSGSASDVWDSIKGAADEAWRYVGAIGAAARIEATDTPSSTPRPPQRPIDFLPGDNAPRAARGGGSSRARTERPFFEDVEATITALERQIETVGKSASEVAELEARWALLDEAQKRGIPVTDDLSAAIDRQAAKVGDLAREYELAQDKMQFFEDVKGDVLDLVTGITDLGSAFEQLAQQIARAAFEAALFGTGPFSDFFGGSGSGIIGAITGKQFASGGFTGFGAKNEPAGVVHKGEYVFDADATRRLGVGNLEALASGQPLRPDFSAMQVSGGTFSPQASTAPTVEANFRAIVVDRYEDRFAALAKTPLFEREVMAIVERNNR